MMRLRCGLLSAGLGVVVFALAGSALGDVPITKAASAHFKAGVNFLMDPSGARYEEAYREFKAAYAESPSWKILGNLGICAMQLERDGEAIQAYQRYLKEGGKQIRPQEREQVSKDLQTLEASVVHVQLTSDPPGATVTDERTPVRGAPIVNRYTLTKGTLSIGIRPGHHSLTAHLDGYVDTRWVFDAAPSATVSHAFHLRKPAEAAAPAPTKPAPAGGVAPSRPTRPTLVKRRPVPTGVYIGVAATGALAIAGGVTGVLALSKKSDFNSKNDGTDPRAAQNLRDAGTRLNLMADIFFGGAVVAAGVTTYLFLTRPEVSVERDTAWQFVPSVGRSGGGVVLSRHF